jgi:hypothetical protein
MFFKIFLTLSFLFSSLLSFSQNPLEHPTKKISKKAKVEEPGTPIPKLSKDQLLIAGNVFCSSCEIKKQKGAKAQCNIYGHSYAIKIKDAKNSEGKILEEYIGKIYQILPNDSSSGLLNEECIGRDVIIVGKIYPDENFIEIDFVKFALNEKTKEQTKEHPSEHPEHPHYH